MANVPSGGLFQLLYQLTQKPWASTHSAACLGCRASCLSTQSSVGLTRLEVSEERKYRVVALVSQSWELWSWLLENCSWVSSSPAETIHHFKTSCRCGTASFKAWTPGQGASDLVLGEVTDMIMWPWADLWTGQGKWQLSNPSTCPWKRTLLALPAPRAAPRYSLETEMCCWDYPDGIVTKSSRGLHIKFEDLVGGCEVYSSCGHPRQDS